jgi:hypothetical protein
MSKYMLCDDATINDINPFVVHDFSLPGGVRQTPEFADYSKDVNTKADIEVPALSPICDIASTAGDRTVDFCTGGRQPPCLLGRPVHPRRNIDYGWTREGRKAAAAPAALGVAIPMPTTNNILSFIGLVMLIALVVSLVRR